MAGLLAWIAGFALMLAGWLVCTRACFAYDERGVGWLLFNSLAAFLVITGALCWRVA
jgi:hypothetical protein